MPVNMSPPGRSKERTAWNELLFSWKNRALLIEGETDARTNHARRGIPLSLIRTLTVGSGITPDLLTPPKAGARGLGPSGHHRRWGISPRPENAGSEDQSAGVFTTNGCGMQPQGEWGFVRGFLWAVICWAL
jgi:hypothetical protein